MSTETEDEVVVVKIEGDAPADQAQQGTKTAETDPVAELAKQVKDLEGKAERERAGREEAQRAAAAARQDAEQARKEADSAKGEAVDDRMAGITAGLEAADAEANAAETEYKTAMEGGDYAAAAKAQRKMAAAEARSQRLAEAKDDLEAQRLERAQPRTEQRAQPEQQRAPADPVEAYIRGRTEPTANWLRQHTDYITDPRKNAKLTAAHWDAVGDGLTPDTTEYFERVETFIGLRKADDGQQQTQTNKPRRAPVAPVTPSGGGTSGGGNEVRLSRGEATAATDGTHVWNYDDPSGQKRFRKGDPIGVQEFARRKQEMQKQGLYDKAHLEA